MFSVAEVPYAWRNSGTFRMQVTEILTVLRPSTIPGMIMQIFNRILTLQGPSEEKSESGCCGKNIWFITVKNHCMYFEVWSIIRTSGIYSCICTLLHYANVDSFFLNTDYGVSWYTLRAACALASPPKETVCNASDACVGPSAQSRRRLDWRSKFDHISEFVYIWWKVTS